MKNELLHSSNEKRQDAQGDGSTSMQMIQVQSRESPAKGDRPESPVLSIQKNRASYQLCVDRIAA